MKNKLLLILLPAFLLAGCGNDDGAVSSSAPVKKASARDTMPAVAIRNTCDACHMVNTKKVGPAWKEVAARYKDDENAVEYLDIKIRKGGFGAWGTMPMPPNPAIADADVEELIAYILGLNK